MSEPSRPVARVRFDGVLWLTPAGFPMHFYGYLDRQILSAGAPARPPY
jgi:hypothetical protein